MIGSAKDDKDRLLTRKRITQALSRLEPTIAPARAQNPGIARTPEKPVLLTKENSDMGWKSRLALNKQMLDNYQSGINTSMINNTARARNTNAFALGQEGNRLTDQGQNLDYATNQAQNETVIRGQDKTQALGEAKDATTRRGQDIQADRNEVLNEGTRVQTETNTMALDANRNRERAQQSYREALAEGNTNDISKTKQNLDTYFYEPDTEKPISAEAKAKIQQKQLDAFTAWRQTRRDLNDTQAMETFRDIQQKLQGKPAFSSSGGAVAKPMETYDWLADYL